MLSTDYLAHGPELGVERRWTHLWLGMTLSQQFPQTVNGADVGMRLLSSGIRILSGLSQGHHVASLCVHWTGSGSGRNPRDAKWKWCTAGLLGDGSICPSRGHT